MKIKTILAAAMAALMILVLAACGKEPTAEPTDKADYSGSVTDWVYAPESDDELVRLLVTIGNDSYGSAGASLQQANAAVSLMKLAEEKSEDTEEADGCHAEGLLFLPVAAGTEGSIHFAGRQQGCRHFGGRG